MRPIIETATGRRLHLNFPDIRQINAHDICYSLSRIARYNGHTSGEFPYSVGQHSLWCAEVAVIHFNATADTALKVLLHDAHKAYTGDIVTPLKLSGAFDIDHLQKHLQNAIEVALGYEPPNETEQQLIKEIDNFALAVEAFHLMPSRGRDWNLPTPPEDIANYWCDPLHPKHVYQELYSRLVALRQNDLSEICA